MSKNRYLLYTGGILFYCTTTYSVYGVTKILNKNMDLHDIHQPSKQKSLIKDSQIHLQFSNLAKTYDNQVDWDEMMMRLGKRRKDLLNRAKGRVLEISCGTGRNLKYYNKENIEKLYLSDNNKEMLSKTWEKCESLFNKDINNKVIDNEIHVMENDDLKFSDNSFDSVVDTFGLCSCKDPVVTLKEMKRVCKKDGEILLLEHGRANGFFKEFIDKILDKSSIDHATDWGCWWNRDIENLVKEAGLIVKEYHRYNFGTTYYIVCSKE
ncbi:Methyltransferase-like protein 7B [Lobulomyces angularis]|nr:Methyltransferase-like protein 7B [Lobulomyces angularis]